MPTRTHKPPPVIADRLRACRTKIHHKKVDGYLVTNRRDQFYLTGFDGEDGAALITPKKVYLLTDGRFMEEAASSAGWAHALCRKGPLPKTVDQLLRKHHLSRLGFQPESLLVSDHAALRRAIRPAKLAPIPNLVTGLRLQKDDREIAAITKAIRVAESAFKAFLPKIRLGMTERQLAAQLQHELIQRGASETSFPIIVAEGPNTSRPHAKPGDRKIRVGSPVMIDRGATVAHYRSDLTRMIFIRRIPPQFRIWYEHVLAAQTEAIDFIKPGVKMCDVDAKARQRLQRAGLGKYFSHGLGHGLGLDVHEGPRLAKRVTDPLTPGMVLTVEPGVYLPGKGGVRIEDDLLVTEKGCRVLSRLSKKLDDMLIS